MGAETDLSPPPLEPTASPEPELLRNGDQDWKADMMSALGDSVSFGRFLSQPLEWGKWSAFEHNRYLEEAAGQSRPGSVAQKKAFFEEHYARKRKSEDDAANDEDVEDDAREADTDAPHGGVARWSANSSCMTDELAAAEEEMRGVDSLPDFGVIVDAAPDAEEELKAITNGERPHKQDDVQAAEARKRSQLDDAGIVATPGSLEKKPLQESSIVNQGITDSVKKRRLPLFQRPMEFSSPPSGKKTPSSSMKRRLTPCSAKENSSPSPSNGSHKQEEGASVAHKRSTFGTLHMSMNFRRGETLNPASRSRNLGSTIASRISQLESASRPGKEKMFGSTSSPVHPKTNKAKENMVNANDESKLKESCPSVRFKARPLPNFYWRNKEPKDSSQQIAQEIPDLPNNDRQLNDASKPHVMSRGSPKDKQICCFPLRKLC